MATGMILDTKEFDLAMIQYAAASGKDFKDIVHRQLNNLAIQGVKLTERAVRAKVKEIESRPWLPRYVSKFLRARQGKFSQADYDRTSKALIRKRLKGIGFLRSFFIKMSQTVAPLTGGKTRKGKKFAGFKISLRKATNRRPNAGVAIVYNYKQRGSETAKGADRLLNKSLQRAIGRTVLDITKYVDRKMGKTAKKYSARGAR